MLAHHTILADALAQDPDLSLLHRYITTGDADLFAEIVRRHSAAVYSTCRRILNDDARAQEISQETFFRLLRQPQRVSQSLGGWLHRSATHLAIDARRSEISRRAREKNYWTDFTGNVGGRETTWEDLPHVDTAIEELPEPEKTLLTRHFLQGIPQAELAAQMNLSAATISRKIKSAVTDLRALLKKKGIYIGLIALLEFCKTESAKAIPPRLLAELTKMALVGPIDIAPAPSSGPSAHRPQLFKLRPVETDSTLHLFGSCMGAIGLIACFSLLSFSISRQAVLIPSRPVSAPQEQKIIEAPASPPLHAGR